jgi:hypothetical protein
MEIDSRLEVTLVSEAIDHLRDRLNLRVEPSCILRPCLHLKGVSRNKTRVKRSVPDRYTCNNSPFDLFIKQL